MIIEEPQPPTATSAATAGMISTAPVGPPSARAGGERPSGRRAGEEPDSQYGALLAGIRFRPVFIMGAHRSGTTLLYQLLAQTGHFSILTMYHIVHYSEIISNHLDGAEERAKRELAARIEALGLTDRLIDGVKPAPDLPEEYGFILQNQHSGRSRLTPATLPTFVELCRKIRFLAGVDRPVLLKNPWDCRNFAYVKEAIPDAKFVFIHRNPIRVIDSELRTIRLATRTRVENVALMSEWYRKFFDRRLLRRHLVRLVVGSPLGWRIILHDVRRACAYYLDHALSLPATDSINLRYEDLCRKPDAAISEVLNFLGMDTPDVDYQQQIKVRDRPLLPEVARHADTIVGLLAPYFSHWGYTSDA